MILCFKLYSMLPKYKILELGKQLSFILFPSFYPEFHRSLLERRLIHPHLEIVFRFWRARMCAHLCVCVRARVHRHAFFWEERKLFIKFSKECIVQKSQ